MNLKNITLLIITLLILLSVSGCKVKRSSVNNAPVSKTAPVQSRRSEAPITEKQKNVIICTSEFMDAARYFSYLHREFEGTRSIIIRVPRFNGTEPSASGIISDINSKVAKLNSNGSLMSILLLGNRSIIPSPSFSTANGTISHVSDCGYGGDPSSPANMLPVGRIPARNSTEAVSVADKYERWYEDRAFRPAWPVSFIGGKGFTAQNLADPELLFFNLQQEGMAGPEAIRYLGAAGGCEPARLKQSLSEDDASVQWLALETSAQEFRAGKGTLHVSQVLALDYKPGLPMALLPSCEQRPVNSTLPTPAQAVVLSPGGALASLTGNGIPGEINAELDQGRVIRVDSNGLPRMLMEFHRAYFSGKHRIGDALTEARAQYIENMADTEDSSPVYEFSFYGDPVMSLPLPVRTESPAYTGLPAVTKPAGGKGVAVFPVNSTISFAMEEGGIYPAVHLQIIDRTTGKTVSAMNVREDDIFNFSADGEGSYLIYSRPLDGPLAWQFFDVRNEASNKSSSFKTAQKKSQPSPRIKAGLKPIQYTIQVSSNRHQDSASKLRSRLHGKGYDAYVVEIPESGNRKWYCVRFGQFDSWAAAVEASAEYERREQADTKIVRCNPEG